MKMEIINSSKLTKTKERFYETVVLNIIQAEKYNFECPKLVQNKLNWLQLLHCAI